MADHDGTNRQENTFSMTTTYCHSDIILDVEGSPLSLATLAPEVQRKIQSVHDRATQAQGRASYLRKQLRVAAQAAGKLATIDRSNARLVKEMATCHNSDMHTINGNTTVMTATQFVHLVDSGAFIVTVELFGTRGWLTTPVEVVYDLYTSELSDIADFDFVRVRALNHNAMMHAVNGNSQSMDDYKAAMVSLGSHFEKLGFQDNHLRALLSMCDSAAAPFSVVDKRAMEVVQALFSTRLDPAAPMTANYDAVQETARLVEMDASGHAEAVKRAQTQVSASNAPQSPKAVGPAPTKSLPSPGVAGTAPAPAAPPAAAPAPSAPQVPRKPLPPTPQKSVVGPNAPSAPPAPGPQSSPQTGMAPSVPMLPFQGAILAPPPAAANAAARPAPTPFQNALLVLLCWLSYYPYLVWTKITGACSATANNWSDFANPTVPQCKRVPDGFSSAALEEVEGVSCRPLSGAQACTSGPLVKVYRQTVITGVENGKFTDLRPLNLRNAKLTHVAYHVDTVQTTMFVHRSWVCMGVGFFLMTTAFLMAAGFGNWAIHESLNAVGAKELLQFVDPYIMFGSSVVCFDYETAYSIVREVCPQSQWDQRAIELWKELLDEGLVTGEEFARQNKTKPCYVEHVVAPKGVAKSVAAMVCIFSVGISILYIAIGDETLDSYDYLPAWHDVIMSHVVSVQDKEERKKLIMANANVWMSRASTVNLDPNKFVALMNGTLRASIASLDLPTWGFTVGCSTSSRTAPADVGQVESQWVCV